jgi:hypothetical protein
LVALYVIVLMACSTSISQTRTFCSPYTHRNEL